MPILYSYELKLLSPLIAVKKAGKGGYSSLELPLPSSMVRGALLTWLYRRGVNVNELNQLRISFSPATLLLKQPVRLGHVFTRGFKIQGKLGRESERRLHLAFSLIGNKLRDLMKRIKCGEKFENLILRLNEETALYVYKELKLDPSLLKSLMDRLFKLELIVEGGVNIWTLVEPSMCSEINVAISKERGASESGMIFSYEAYPAGLRLTGDILDLDGMFTKLLEEYCGSGEVNFIVGLGRGSSRGYGLARMRLRRGDLNRRLSSLEGGISEALGEWGLIPLEAFSPTLSLQPSKAGLCSAPTPPKIIELPNSWLHPGWLDTGNSKLRMQLIDAYGKTFTVKGFSLRTGFPKPWLKAGLPGSLYLYKVKEAVGESWLLLAYLELAGLNELSRLGFNRLRAFTSDPFPSLKELKGVVEW